MGRFSLLMIGLLGVLLMGACSDNSTGPLDALNGDGFSGEANFARSPMKGSEPIAAIAINNGFDSLVTALSYVDEELNAGLVDLFLNGTDQYTVFAPTNDAFVNLLGLLSQVLQTEIDEIGDIPAGVVLDVLLYHVAEGRRGANSVVPPRNLKTIESLLGETFAVRTDLTIRDGLTGVRANDAMIDTPDLSASNGIIHVITEVIVPPSVVAALTG